jgi:hypothetical protein
MSDLPNRHRGVISLAARLALAGSVVVVALTSVSPDKALAASQPAQTSTALTYYTTASQVQDPTVGASDHVVLVAVVTPISGAIPATGTVTFFDGVNPLGAATLHSHLATAYAILFIAPMSRGDHTITAHYSGDETFSPSSATPVPLAIAAPHEAAMSGDFIQGGVTTVDARGSGPAATGEVDLVGHFHATVTCLQVSGRHGIATTVIDSSQDPSYRVGQIVVVEGVDNGNPTLTSVPDLWRASFDNGGIHQVSSRCWLPIFPPVAIQAGNIVVVDKS